MTEEASRILSEAGWTADAGWGGFTYGTCVGGLAPDGNVYVKNWAAIQPGHPKYSADTPDTAEEAAQWLADRYKAPVVETNALSLESLEFRIEDEVEGLLQTHLAQEPEPVENPGDESNGETGEASGDGESASELVFEPSDEGDAERVDLFDSESVPVEPLDADFTEGEDLGSELLDAHDTILEGGDPWSTPELPAPEPEDFAPDEIAPEPENDQARFYGLDDLDRVKRLRIGDVAAEAAVRISVIEAAAKEREGEYAAVQSFVVTNLDKFTGAFTLQDEASQATARRFYELDAARSQISVVDRKRKEATAWLLDAERTREDVVNFSVEAAFA